MSRPEIPPEPAQRAPDRLFSRAFVAVFGAALVFFIASGIVLPVAPRFAEGPIGADPIGFGIAIGVFAIASLAVRPVVGWAADRFGRRPLLVGGAVATVAALAIHVAATDLAVFVGARALLGVGEAAFLVAAIAAGGDLAPRSRTGEAISLLSLSIYVGLVVGPAAGEALLGARGYPAVWVAAGVLAAVSGALAWLVPETRPEEPAGAAPRGRLFHPAGVLPGVLILCGLWAMACFLTFVALHAVAMGLDGAGPALAVFGAVVLLVRLFGARLPDLVGPLRLTAAALACTAAGSVLIGVLPGLGGLLAGSAVLAIGVALTMPAVLSFAMGRAPASERGSVVGTASLFLDLSFGLVPVVLAPVAAAYGFPAIFVVSGAVALLGLVVLTVRRASLVPAPAPAG